MADSSDDDKPLGQRKFVNVAASLLKSDSDDGSPIPEWISQNTPEKPALTLDDSDSDADLIDLATQPDTQEPEQIANGAEKGKQNGIAGAKATKPLSQAFVRAGKTKGAAPSSAGKLPPAGASQAAAQVPAMPDAAPGAEIPLVLPEKLQGLRYLVELEGSSEAKTDLAGDAGAVGRFSLAGGSGKEKAMLLDLKGRLYNTSVPSEAKVEAMLDSYVSLFEDEQHAQGMENKDIFMYDDDEADAYQVADDDKQTQKPGKRKAKEENEDAPKAKRKPQTKQSTARKKVTTKPKGIGKGASKGKKR